jgi:glycosyltransferase involved in cell wall biosynthesis
MESSNCPGALEHHGSARTATGVGAIAHCSRMGLHVFSFCGSRHACRNRRAFADREPVNPRRATVGVGRTLHLHFNDLDVPRFIPRGTDHASVFETARPIVVRRARPDSRCAEVTLLSAIAQAKGWHAFFRRARPPPRNIWRCATLARQAGFREFRKTMKIAQIAPLMESVPPRMYGGTERIVSYLSDELVRLGHDVTLFATGDSVSSATLVPCAQTALRLDNNVRDPIPYYMLMLDRVRERAEEFDILHFHIDQFHFPLFRTLAPRTVTTLHGRQDIPDLKPLYIGFAEMPLVSISHAQRGPVAGSNFVATVHHGIPTDLHKPICNPRGGYVAFLGRISPEKRPDRAVRIAQALGIPLKIAAKVDKTDEAYFRAQIAPLLDQPGVEFVGEISERRKVEFLGEARALLFPVDWPEPFGLVMIEAMACGTPVLAFRRGSVPEIVDQDVTGCIVDTTEQAVRILPHVMALDRSAVRRRFEQRFSAARMAKDYVQVYHSLIRQAQSSERATAAAMLQPALGKGMN